MLWQIRSARPAAILLAITFAAGRESPAQAPCPPAGGAAVESGWRAYRSDSLEAAAKRFGQAEQLCPGNLDAMVGLGFTLLRLDRLDSADALFRRVVARDSGNADGWEGRTRASYRKGDVADARRAGRRALDLNPKNGDLRALLDRISPDWDRPVSRPRKRPAALQLVARTRGRGFEIAGPRGWQPFYLQGVNLGVALPGKYPSEFPLDSLRYAGWLDTLAAMHANTLRVYTILPPSFYRALRGWNLSHPKRPLWLVHGVWTELPPHDTFDDPAWEGDFQHEMRRVVDLIHGAAEIPARPGHAAGRYDADVSTWTLGYIIGREWEPFAVKAFDELRPESRAYHGRYLEVPEGRAMDVWLVRQCDYMLRYEVDTYNALRPIAYTNWPTLDPLTHPTESTTSEEAAWRRRSGRSTEGKKLEYDNDAIGLDANLVRPTAANPAGWFASYHAYPYYPDFMILDPGYQSARSSEGPSSYFGYLRDLVQHHRGIPTVISEYGVPSSRGNAHIHPQGWSHGGHDEQAMARIDARLTREIREAGAAGAILFAWLDEWFKKNWVVIDFEIPLDNTRQWHNVMDAEQNYGILGQYAGEARTTPRLGGDPSRWRELPLIQRPSGASGRTLRALRAGSDESYLYLAVELEPGRFGWDSLGLQLAIDTYRPAVGQHRLPRSGVRSELGFEFLVDLVSLDSARIGVTPDYNRHESRVDPVTGDDAGRFYRRPIITASRDDARFDSLFVITNRARFGRDGSSFPARGYDRGRLAHGTETSSTLSDWYLDERAGLLELRIAWDLLNVTDPSTRTLLYDPGSTGDFGTAAAEDFHVGVVVYRKSLPRAERAAGAETPVAVLPALEQGVWRVEGFTGWRWAPWQEPRSHARLKPVYDSLRSVWAPAGAPALRAQRAP
ncbi:MAG TPA: tetratricopeptide repeat protein [Gemmatimonadales bacterium]